MQEDEKKAGQEKDATDDERSNTGLSTESEDANSRSVGRGQDSNASLASDTDDDMNGAEQDKKDWMEHIKRSAHEAEEKMKTFNIFVL